MVAEQKVRELAYQLWEQAGRPDGNDLEHYYEAQAAIVRDEHEAPASSSSSKTPRKTRTSTRATRRKVIK